MSFCFMGCEPKKTQLPVILPPISAFLSPEAPKKVLNSKSVANRLNVDSTEDSVFQVVDVKVTSLNQIDCIIKDILIKRGKTIPALEDTLLSYISSLKTSSPKEREIINNNIRSIRKKILSIQSSFDYGYYVLRTQDILSEYEEILKSTSSRSFVVSNIEDVDNEANNSDTIRRSDLYDRYISVAKEYVKIGGLVKKRRQISCPNCDGKITHRSLVDETTVICGSCSVEIDTLDDTPTFKDTDRVNMTCKYNYTRKGHFIDSLKKHQGKQSINSDILVSILVTMRTEMKYHHLTESTVTKDHIYKFLAEKKLSAHYEDLNLIYSILTSKPCFDFCDIEYTLLELFDIQEEALNDISKNGGRVNSINVYYKILKLLQHMKYPTKKSDFYILKTTTKKDEHDEHMKQAWSCLGWPWIET